MDLFVLWEGKPIPVKREISESDLNFARRVEFLLYALDSGIPAHKAEVLSHCFLNRLLYGSRYSAALEAQIDSVQRISGEVQGDAESHGNGASPAANYRRK